MNCDPLTSDLLTLLVELHFDAEFCDCYREENQHHADHCVCSPIWAQLCDEGLRQAVNQLLMAQWNFGDLLLGAFATSFGFIPLNEIPA